MCRAYKSSNNCTTESKYMDSVEFNSTGKQSKQSFWAFITGFLYGKADWSAWRDKRVGLLGEKYCKTWKIYACKVCKLCILLYYAYHKMAELPVNVVSVIQKCTKFANFASVYFPYFTIFRHQTWQFYYI